MTLVLAKPSDIALILNKLNNYHPDIQFTQSWRICRQKRLSFSGYQTYGWWYKLTIFQTNTHTGQYIHFSSFTPLSYKLAWIRTLVSRAHKICSIKTLLSVEINTIFSFVSWNGFSKRVATKLNKQMTPNSDQIHTNYKASWELTVFL